MSRLWKEAAWGKYGGRDGRPQAPDGEQEDEEEDRVLLTERRRDLKREQKGTVAMGVILLLSSGILAFKAQRKYRFWNKW